MAVAFWLSVQIKHNIHKFYFLIEPVLRRVFGPRREWKILHKEELNDLYSSPNIVRVIKSRKMRWAGNVARMGEERGAYRVLVGKPEVKRPMGRPRRRWVDNIKMDLKEVGCGYMDLIGLTQIRDRWWTLLSAVMNLRVAWNAGNFLTSCKPVSCSGRTLHHGVSNRACVWLCGNAISQDRSTKMKGECRN